MKLLAIFTVLLPGMLFAESKTLKVPFPASAEIITYVCDYPRYSDPNGNHKVDEKFTLTFVINFKSGNSYMLGNMGKEEIKLVANTYGLSFVETTYSGNIQVTAIDENLNSVHSRSSIIDGHITPSQFYGSCQKK